MLMNLNMCVSRFFNIYIKMSHLPYNSPTHLTHISSLHSYTLHIQRLISTCSIIQRSRSCAAYSLLPPRSSPRPRGSFSRLPRQSRDSRESPQSRPLHRL
ncbi:Os02g0437300 [Oryza sativa Japonica Group]|uniref:Os02g0437300 protein n=1 Tax=Oryza sativa subsp. japonica TaxID=39947 RepID=Q0E1I6_ORYSJ|nr:Os02g0437300 [Oryza sativa Japonica Group]|eukprot:NP_001046738.1 Os02g0437300 [Oryza sativa Japonica Group]